MWYVGQQSLIKSTYHPVPDAAELVILALNSIEVRRLQYLSLGNVRVQVNIHEYEPREWLDISVQPKTASESWW